MSSECGQSVFKVCSISKSFHHLAHLVCQFLAFFRLDSLPNSPVTIVPPLPIPSQFRYPRVFSQEFLEAKVKELLPCGNDLTGPP